MTDQDNLEKLSVYSWVTKHIKNDILWQKTSCGKAAVKNKKNKYLGTIMTHIKIFFRKYKKNLIS